MNDSDLNFDNSILISGSIEYYESIGIKLIAALCRLATEGDCGEAIQADWNTFSDYLVEYGSEESDSLCETGEVVIGNLWLRYLASGMAKAQAIKRHQWIFSTVAVTQKWPSEEIPKEIFDIFERMADYWVDFSAETSLDELVELFRTKVKSESVPLWNPSAAATWSLIFTPVFGCILHSLNWRSMNEYERMNNSSSWMYIGLGMIFLYAIIANHSSVDEDIILVMRFAYFVFFAAWYFMDAKVQIAYVNDRYGSVYKRRSWILPILIGLAATAVLIVIS